MRQKPPPPSGKDVDPSRLISFGGPVDNVRVSLRMFGDELKPDEITSLMHCEPSQSFRLGDVIPDQRYHRLAKTGRWILEGDKSNTGTLDEQITALLSQVTSDLEVWKRLSREHDIDIFAGLFLDEGNRECDLSPSTLRLLADRNLTVTFDIYA